MGKQPARKIVAPKMPAVDAARAQALALLRHQLQGWERTFHSPDLEVISTGCPEFDQLLPQKGFLAGQLVEWRSPGSAPRLNGRQTIGIHGGSGPGSGAELLALLVARQALAGSPQQVLVVIDAWGDFYPPAAAAWGVDLRRLVVVHPAGQGQGQPPASPRSQSRAVADLFWALDQSLRCPAIAVVLTWLPAIDPRDYRRLQLAAEEGKTLGMLLRDARTRGQVSWADIQLQVTPFPGNQGCGSTATARTSIPARRCLVQLLRCRHGVSGGSIHLQMDEVSRTIRGISSSTSSSSVQANSARASCA